MKITKLEQSGFIFESASGQRLALDIGMFTPIESLSSVKPVEYFLVSHIHGDHFSLEHIQALSPKTVLLNPQCHIALGETQTNFEIKEIKPDLIKQLGDFKITSFEVDHGPNVSAPVQDNQGFLIEVDNLKIYFAGDMFYPCSIAPEHQNVDLALIPIGGYYTFDSVKAAEFIAKFKAIKLLVPMHYHQSPSSAQEFAGQISSAQQLKILDHGEEINL